jgi:hypothetical protein
MKFDAQEIKRRLPFLDLMAHEGVALRRSGPHYVARCPFHEEGTGSFTVHAPAYDHGHCYGCGWNGDIFEFWKERHGGVFSDAIAALASLASVSPEVFEFKRKQAALKVPQMTETSKQKPKPTLPRLRALTDEEIEALASQRKLDKAGIAQAAVERRVGACVWPQFLDHNGAWATPNDAVVSWVVTDRERSVAQFRRLDGLKYTRKDGKAIKAWTKGSPTWPIGAAEIGDRVSVLLVEGGADMLAGYHFLVRFNRLQHVAVCAMLGASMRICDSALPLFRRKRVRIVMDEDEPKDDRGIRPGCEAAARWTGQLSAAGAAVETFSLAGLVRKDGQPVKDLNDLALVDEAAWLDPELRQLFFDFDF